jgi:hypothetical protein
MEDKKIKQKTTPEGHVYYYEGEEELVKDPKENSKKLKEKWEKIKKSLLSKKAEFIDIMEDEEQNNDEVGEEGGSILEPDAIAGDGDGDVNADEENQDLKNDNSLENVDDADMEDTYSSDEPEDEEEDSDFSDFLDEYFKSSEDSPEDGESTTDDEKIEYLKSLGYNSEEIKQIMGVPANRGFGDDEEEADWSNFNNKPEEELEAPKEEDKIKEEVVEEDVDSDNDPEGNKKEPTQKNNKEKQKEKPQKKEENKKNSKDDDGFYKKIIEKLLDK